MTGRLRSFALTSPVPWELLFGSRSGGQSQQSKPSRLSEAPITPKTRHSIDIPNSPSVIQLPSGEGRQESRLEESRWMLRSRRRNLIDTVSHFSFIVLLQKNIKNKI